MGTGCGAGGRPVDMGEVGVGVGVWVSGVRGRRGDVDYPRLLCGLVFARIVRRRVDNDVFWWNFDYLTVAPHYERGGELLVLEAGFAVGSLHQLVD